MPLQMDEEYLEYVGRLFGAWKSALETRLLKYGTVENFAQKKASDIATELVILANNQDNYATPWVEQLVRRGLSLPFLKEVEQAIRHYERRSTPRLDPRNKTFVWVGTIDDFEPEDDPHTFYALLISLLVETGIANRIRRCKECKIYFVGDPRAKWCSNKCGSKNRVRKKRRADKSRNLESRGI